jgi:hypothetical protein
MTIFPKQKPKSRSRRKRVYGGAIFASAVFMVLSMMVILQNEQLMKREASLASNGLVADYALSQLQMARNDLVSKEQQLNICDKLVDDRDARLNSIIAITDLDDRWWEWKVRDDIGLASPSNPEFIVHRPSPSGLYTAIAVGDKDSAEPRRALGFFILNNNFYKGVRYWIPSEGYIKNIAWQGDDYVTFDLVSTQLGGKTTQEKFVVSELP